MPINKWREYQIAWFCVVFVLLAACQLWADPNQVGPAERTAARATGRGLSEEGRADALKIRQSLETILADINCNRRTEQALLETSQQLLEDNKSNMSAYEVKQRATFMLLQSWTDFYLLPQKDSSLWAARAYKMDPTNQDAWASQALLSMMNGKKVKSESTSKSSSRRAGGFESGRGGYGRSDRNRRREPEPLETETSNELRKGLLDFGPEMLQVDMTGRKFSQLKMQSSTGEKVEFKAGTGNVVCLLLFQEGGESSAGQGYGFQGQRDYFEYLLEEFKDNADVHFVQVNTAVPKLKNTYGGGRDVRNSRGSRGSRNARSRGNRQMQQQMQRQRQQQMAQAKALDDFFNSLPTYEELDYPTIVATHPKSGGRVFAGMDIRRPFMVIVNQNGKVNYAGAAEGFAPAFVLMRLTGVEIDLEKQREAAEPYQAVSPGMMDPEMMEMMMPMMQPGRPAKAPKPLPDPNRPATDPNIPAGASRFVADPNKPAADPNTPAKAARPVTQPAAAATKTYRELPFDEDIQAQKKMTYARDLFMNTAKYVTTYKNGVKLCREIIRDYPGTKYEHEARMLLRKVPENKRHLYKITDDELMLP
ncbi:MAG: hypothetical protein ABFR90_00885 [Planctomycetota bacterium]